MRRYDIRTTYEMRATISCSAETPH